MIIKVKRGSYKPTKDIQTDLVSKALKCQDTTDTSDTSMEKVSEGS